LYIVHLDGSRVAPGKSSEKISCHPAGAVVGIASPETGGVVVVVLAGAVVLAVAVVVVVAGAPSSAGAPGAKTATQFKSMLTSGVVGHEIVAQATPCIFI
jgi:hypothetical protein